MAFIGESRKSNDHPWDLYLCLDKKDCEVLSQVIGSLVARKMRTFEYYKGIHEGGEATEKQVDKLFKAEAEFEAALNIQEAIFEFLKLGKDER